MKRKFIQKLHDHANGIPTKQPRRSKRRTAQTMYFSEYGEEWLKIKEQTTPSTFKDDERLFHTNNKPVFGNLKIVELDRSWIRTNE